MKYIIIFFSVFSLTAYSQEKKSIKIVESEEEYVIPFSEFDISLIKLIATPEKYDGKQVQVKGYLNLEFEGNAIYLHEEDYSKSLTDNGFWVNFSNDISAKINLSDYNKKYVIIIGTFDMKSLGHMGLFGGTIKNITRVDLWD